jgi:Zn-finger nucleic acid-binding protein
MAEEKNNNKCYKCPHCACIFLTNADLEKHMKCFGDSKEQHASNYQRTHGRIEHGYGEE